MVDTPALLNLDELTFPAGLVGLPDLRHFKLQQSVDMVPVALLHSKDEKGLSFIVANPLSWYPEYRFDITDEEMASIKAARIEDLVVLTIINVTSDPFQVTANMISPLVINPTSRLGLQPVLEHSPYLARQPLSLKTITVILKDGMLGIPEWKNFVLQIVDELMPVMLLASQDAPRISFPVVDPWFINPDYDPKLTEDDKIFLGANNEKDLAWFVILSVQTEPLLITANLMSPVVLNSHLNIARQVLLSKSGYPTAQPIKVMDMNLIKELGK